MPNPIKTYRWIGIGAVVWHSLFMFMEHRPECHARKHVECHCETAFHHVSLVITRSKSALPDLLTRQECLLGPPGTCIRQECLLGPAHCILGGGVHTAGNTVDLFGCGHIKHVTMTWFDWSELSPAPRMDSELLTQPTLSGSPPLLSPLTLLIWLHPHDSFELERSSAVHVSLQFHYMLQKLGLTFCAGRGQWSAGINWSWPYWLITFFSNELRDSYWTHPMSAEGVQ